MFLKTVGAATLLVDVALARAYFFRIPLWGVTASLAFYLTGISAAGSPR